MDVIFILASVPSDFEYNISGKEFNDHFSSTNGCHFTFPHEKGGLAKFKHKDKKYEKEESKDSHLIHSFTTMSDMKGRDCIIT